MKRKCIDIVLILSFLAAALRTVIIINNMETNSDNHTYYLLDTPIAKSFTFIAIGCLLGVSVLAFLHGKGKKAVLDSSDALTSAASCTLGLVMLGSFAVYMTTPATNARFSEAVAVLSVLSALTFILLGFYSQNKKLSAVLGLLPMLFTLFRLFADFLSSSSAPFANSGSYHLMGLCAFLLFLLCANKANLEIGSSALLFGFGYVAMFLLLVYALPNLILHCFDFGIFTFNYSATLSVVDFVSVFYIASKLNAASCASMKENTSEIATEE